MSPALKPQNASIVICLLGYWSVHLLPWYDKYLTHCFSLCSCRMYINHQSQTMRVILKRKFAEVDDDPCYSSSSPPSSLSSPASSGWESDGESSSSDNQDFSPHSPSLPTILPSKSSTNQQPLFSSPHFQIMQTSSLSAMFYGSVSYHLAAALSWLADMKMLSL